MEVDQPVRDRYETWLGGQRPPPTEDSGGLVGARLQLLN